MGREEYQAGDLVFAILMLFIVMVLLVSIPFETKWFDGVPLVKQPRLWPTFCLVGMALFGFLYSIQIWKNYKFQLGQLQGELNELSSWLRPLEFVFYFVLYVWFVPLMGYLLSTLLFFSLLTIRTGYRTLFMFWVSLATGFGIVVLFKSLLKVRITSGAIYDYLPDGWATFFMIYF